MSKIVGNVKWFDSRKGYGFVTVVTPNHELLNNDVFVHYSSIQCENYKRVYPGEYVEFELEEKNGKKVCINVTGLFGNKLLSQNENFNYKIYPKKDNVPDEDDEAEDDEAENVEVSN